VQLENLKEVNLTLQDKLDAKIKETKDFDRQKKRYQEQIAGLERELAQYRGKKDEPFKQP